MPLERLRVHNFRGIRDVDLNCAGKNIAIVGPNGSGKSSVVDALDFLLSGQIKRLTGEGAGSLSLLKHGPNVAADARTAAVEAEFSSISGERVVLRRRPSAPDSLESDGPIPDDVQRVIDLAQTTSQHVLSRREILRYIFTEPGKRADQVAALLQLTGIDSLRKEIQGAAKSAADNARQAAAISANRLTSVLRSFDPPASSWDDILSKANARRQVLAAPALESLEPAAIRSEVVQPTAAAANPLQSQRTRELLERTSAWSQTDAELTVREIIGYWENIRREQAQSERLKAMRSVQLLTTGLPLAIANECPLCLREWDNEELRAVLNERLRKGREAEAELRELQSICTSLRSRLTSFAATARSLGEQVKLVEAVHADALLTFSSALGKTALTIVVDPLGDVSSLPDPLSLIERLLPSDVVGALDAIQKGVNTAPQLSGVQKAWDELGALEGALHEYNNASHATELADRAAKELSAADKLFVISRDTVLQETYDAIASRFAAIYAQVHAEDEGTFKASLNPTKTGLKLEVDFYGVGEFPPCAVHSEGHQDSMGICLFLTLTEFLSAGPVPFLVLDDVVMSVDRNHRRAVASLLKTEFGHCQFVITTHDKVWWRQLRSVGLVTSKGSVEFKSWSLDAGPTIIVDAGRLLRESAEALNRDDIPSAAHALRRAVEAYLPDVCDALAARVRFHADGAFEAGDFLDAALGRYGDIVGMARNAAQSWGNSDIDWKIVDEMRKTATSSFQGENWAVNANVHFNEWADFSAADFQPVLDAYERLFALFICSKCDATLNVLYDGKDAIGFRCDCSATNWNLKAKSKS